MKTKIILATLLTLIGYNFIFAQASGNSDTKVELEVEEFLGVFHELLSEQMIDELGYRLPDTLKVINYDLGDYSGDGLKDVVIAYKTPLTPSKTFEVMFLVNFENRTFIPVSEIRARWIDIPYDVGFLIKDGVCNMTHRVGTDWHFTTYNYASGQLQMIRDLSEDN